MLRLVLVAVKTFAQTLAVLVALFFLFGAIVTAAPSLFGGSKVRTLFNDSQDALAAQPVEEVVGAANTVVDAGAPAPVRDPLYMHATKAGPMPVPRPTTPPVDAGKAAEPRPPDAGPRVFFPASKSMGGLGLPTQATPVQQAPQ